MCWNENDVLYDPDEPVIEAPRRVRASRLVRLWRALEIGRFVVFVGPLIYAAAWVAIIWGLTNANRKREAADAAWRASVEAKLDRIIQLEDKR